MADQIVANELIQADSSGIVYHYHADKPDKYKRWSAVSVLADGTVGGAMFVGYRIDSFDTSATGWTDYTFDLTTRTTEKTIAINKTAQQLQVRLHDFSGNAFNCRECSPIDVEIDDEIQAEFSGLAWQFDGGAPHLFKRWPKLSIAVEGTTGGALNIGYRTDGFDDTLVSTWTDFTLDLTEDIQEETFYINKTSKRIQIAVYDISDVNQFRVRDLNLIA